MSEYTQFAPLRESDRRRSSQSSAPAAAASEQTGFFRRLLSGLTGTNAPTSPPPQPQSEPVLKKEQQTQPSTVDESLQSSHPWMPDRLVSRCHSCDLNFTAVRRRHHCRICGQIFCSSCSDNFLDRSYFGFSDHEVIRVCNFCFQGRKQQLKILQLNALEEGDQSFSPHPQAQSQSLLQDQHQQQLHQQPGSSDHLLRSPQPSNHQQQQQHQQQQHHPLHGHALRRSSLYPSSASDSDSRLLDGSSGQPFSGPAVSTGSSSLNESFSNLLSDSDLDENGPASRSFWDEENVPSYPIDRRPSTIAALAMQQPSPSLARRGGDVILRKDSQGHLVKILRSLFRRDDVLMNLTDQDAWVELMTDLALSATRKVFLSLEKDLMDVTSYVRVKLIPGGSMSDSHHLRGLALAKTVALKQMRSRLEKPRILLMGCAVEFSRPDWKFVGFEELQEQEHAFLRILVDRIVSLRPDMLITSETISSVALEFLLAAGITCVTRVKRPILDRLARFTGASIVSQLSDIPSSVLGTSCELVRNQTFEMLTGSRSYLIFDNCRRRTGGTVILRGHNTQVLHAMKKILLFGIYAAYHLRLESAFVLDMSLHEMEFLRHAPDGYDDVYGASQEGDADHLGGGTDAGTSSDVNGSSGPSSDGVNKNDSPDPVSISPGITFAPPLPKSCTVPIMTVRNDSAKAGKRAADLHPYPDLVAIHERGGGWIRSLNFDFESAIMDPQSDPAMKPLTGQRPTDILENQSIVYSFTQHHAGKRSHCVTYQNHLIEFYSRNDMSLSLFLQWCRESAYCPIPSCVRPMYEHEHSFLYGKFRLYVSTSALPEAMAAKLKDAQKEEVTAWFGCNECLEASEPRKLSHESLSLSFGKMLELVFLDRSLSCSVGHRLNPSGTLAFASRGKLTSIAFLRTPVFTVHPPPLNPRFNMEAERKRVEEELTSLAAEAHITYDVIKRRLDTPSLRDVLDREEGDFLQNINDAKHSRLLQVNQLVRALFTNVMRWEAHCENGAGDQQSANSSMEYGPGGPPSSGVASLSASGGDGASTPVAISSAPSLSSDASASASSSSSSTASLLVVPPSSVSLGTVGAVSGGGGSNSSGPGTGNSSPRLPNPVLLSNPSLALEMGSGVTHSAQSTPSLSRLPLLAADASVAQKIANVIKSKQQGPLIRSLQQEICDEIASTLDKNRLLYRLFTGQGAPMPLSALTQEFVIVLDQEPSTHIACALGTDSYREQMHNVLGPMLRKEMRHSMDYLRLGSGGGLHGKASQQATLDFETLDKDVFVRLAMAATPKEMEVSFESMLPKLQYSCNVTIHYPLQFAALRRLFCGSDAAFVYSMARSQSWEAKAQGGGGSKATFVSSHDDLYLLKSVQPIELKNFQAFATKYFEYVLSAAKGEGPTLLVKIVGMFSIDVKNPLGMSSKQDYMVMEKLFHSSCISRTFDLKGSVRNRLKPDSAPVLQDENLRRMMWSNPLVIDDKSKDKLSKAIWNDSYFLSQVSVMDYSILVGVDERSNQLMVGIIDYIRPYSWDKAVEYLMKSAPGLISGSQKKPTILSPNDYRDRFRIFTWNCFIMSPTRNARVYLRQVNQQKEEEAVPVVVMGFDE